MSSMKHRLSSEPGVAYGYSVRVFLIDSRTFFSSGVNCNGAWSVNMLRIIRADLRLACFNVM